MFFGPGLGLYIGFWSNVAEPNKAQEPQTTSGLWRSFEDKDLGLLTDGLTRETASKKPNTVIKKQKRRRLQMQDTKRT